MIYLEIYILIAIIVIPDQICAVVPKSIKTGIEVIWDNYLKPLQKLTEKLPNHAIEMEIEIQDSSPTTTTKRMRLFRIIRPEDLGIRRFGSKAAHTRKKPITKQKSTFSWAATTSVNKSVITALRANPVASSKKPIYVDDLKRAMDEFASRLASMSTPPLREPSYYMPVVSSTDEPVGIIQKLNQPLNEPLQLKRVGEVINLLKQAVNVERHHKPDCMKDDNLDWLQVKIPKNLSQ